MHLIITSAAFFAQVSLNLPAVVPFGAPKTILTNEERQQKASCHKHANAQRPESALVLRFERIDAVLVRGIGDPHIFREPERGRGAQTRAIVIILEECYH